MESGPCKADMNLIRGGRYHSLDNTYHSFVLSSHVSILPLIWAKIGYVRACSGSFVKHDDSVSLNSV